MFVVMMADETKRRNRRIQKINKSETNPNHVISTNEGKGAKVPFLSLFVMVHR